MLIVFVAIAGVDAPRLAEKYSLEVNPAERLGRQRRGIAHRFELVWGYSV
jgi:hypothetical protein